MSQEMWTNLILSACATLFTAAGAPAQAPQSGQAAPKPEFEVASVKPAGPYVPGSNLKVCGGPGTDDPGQFTYPRASLLLRRAPASRISAGRACRRRGWEPSAT